MAVHSAGYANRGPPGVVQCKTWGGPVIQTELYPLKFHMLKPQFPSDCVWRQAFREEAEAK